MKSPLHNDDSYEVLCIAFPVGCQSRRRDNKEKVETADFQEKDKYMDPIFPRPLRLWRYLIARASFFPDIPDHPSIPFWLHKAFYSSGDI